MIDFKKLSTEERRLLLETPMSQEAAEQLREADRQAGWLFAMVAVEAMAEDEPEDESAN